MEKNIQDKITALEAAINSPATPENIKETMRKALDTLRNQKVEVALYKTYSTIKSCLLDDGDDSDDYIYEGKRIHNVEVLPKDTWEIVEFYNYGVVLKHIPTSVLADSKPNKNVSLDELKVLFASDKIEIDGIEKGNTKVFNLCIKAIIKCIDSLDMAAYKENLLAELNVSKNELEKTIEASNLLESEKNAILSEKSNLEKESAEKIQTLESDMAAKSISMEEAKAIQEAETLRLKKQIEDLDALNSMRTLIDMLTDDIAKKDFKETPSIESNEKIKVKEIRLFAAEGKVSGYGFPKVVNTYEEANDAVMPVYEDAIESSYANKCRFTVTFEDGETYNGDLFVGAKYDNPTKGNVIGKHIKDYLESEIKENRQSEETKKEIREFFEKYDLGFDENKLDEKNPKYKVGDILLHEYMGEKQKAKILAVTGWTGDGHRYEIEFVDKNNNGIGKFATSYDDILTKDAANGDYEDINAFVDYVNDFYGKDGIYAKDFSNNGFTKEEIKEAVNKYISDIDKRDDDDFTWGDGDSVDRERVRQYLQPNGLKFNDGDFVFANMDSRDPKSKTPFVISHYSNGKYYILGDGSHYVSEDKLSLATEKDFDDYYTELGFDKKAIDSYKNIKYSNGGELKVPYQEIITHTKGEIDLTKSRDEFAKEFSELYGKQNKKRVTPKTIEYFRNDSGSYHTVRDVLEDIETNDFNDVISVFKKVYPVSSNDWKEALRTGLLVKAEKREGNYYNKPYIYNEPIAVKIREARLDNLKPLIEEILSDDKYENGGSITKYESVNSIREKVNSFLNPLNFTARVEDLGNGLIHIEPSTKKVGSNRTDFFDGMQINRFEDGTYEVSEYQAGKNNDELYIYKETKSLLVALKDLIKGNKRRPIKKYEKGGSISNERFIFGIEYKESPTSRVFKKSSLTMVGRDTKEMNDAINENANLLKNQEGWHDFRITKTPIMENGGSINDKITSKAKHEVDFLTKKGYDIDVYSTLNQDAIFGGEKTDDFIIATQGSIGTGKDVKFAIAYWYKDEEDGEMQISRALLDEISDLFKGSPVTLYTNAGVDLHSITDGKHKNIQVVKVPYGEFSGNSDEYAEGGQIEMSFSAEEQKDWSKEKTRMYDLYAVAHNNIADLKDELKRAKLRKDSQLVRMLESRIRQTEFAKKSAKEYFDKYEKGGKLKGSWGQSFPEEGRTGMYKGASVIVTSNRAGDILFDELDEDEKVVKSDKASLSEFRSYFRPFEPRETDVIYEKGGEIKIVQKQLDDNKDLSFEIYPKGEKMTIENGFHGILVDGKLKNTIYIGNEYYDIDGVVYKNDKKTNLKL